MKDYYFSGDAEADAVLGRGARWGSDNESMDADPGVAMNMPAALAINS